MLHKAYVPTVPSLMKICDGFGISLAQFFTTDSETAKLTADQRTCLEHWSQLDKHSQELALAFMDGLAARQKIKPSESVPRE
jgi:hypothetical protein